ncbi:hypothetical protein PACTADRAFT_48205 [Pachysolen tannophilus NRRL Y-2460]|uniref:Chromosome segregation in meiosis protein n=1 Tax=Pachysolen tannophilus NRRL Y-2460 TaxID=669874 RepID=A0A1E4U377_PACTA|nr:hypothetical protein PACTADRAFT_48205 [Pachysolen tannophilus NRRL Y-2460]
MELEQESSFSHRGLYNGFEEEHPDSPEAHQEVSSSHNDILGLEKEVQIKTRRKLVTLNQDKLLSRNGLPYIQKNYKRIKLHHGKDYGSSVGKSGDFTSSHYYKNLSNILQFYQLWAHNLFPKANFTDFIKLANRQSSGNSAKVHIYRRGFIEAEICRVFPDDAIVVGQQQDATYEANDNDNANENENDNGAGINSGEPLSPELNNNSLPGERDEIINNDDSLISRTNGLFVGEEDNDEEELYTTSKRNNIVLGSDAEDHGNRDQPAITSNNQGNENVQQEDEFSDEDADFTELLNKKAEKISTGQLHQENEEEFPSMAEGFESRQAQEDEYEDEMDVLRAMGM